MVKLAPRDVASFLKQPDARIRAVLVYGPDQGLVRERGQALLRAVAGDAADPFRVAALDTADVRADPARLSDEAAALAFGGGQRVVHIRAGDDGIAVPVRDWLRAPVGDALVVIEAGELPPRSPLRRLFEATEATAAIACYRDDARSLPAVLAELLREHGLRASAEAMAYLQDRLGGDRLLTRREIEKLALYVAGGAEGGDGPAGHVDLAAAQACVGDSADVSLDDLAFAVGDGDLPALQRALERSQQEGAAPVRALRAVARHFANLHLVAGLLAQGQPLQMALKGLGRPVFWRYAPRFANQCKTWTPAALGGVIRRLLQAEAACKRTGAPEAALAAQALLDIATGAPSRHRR